MKKLKVALAMIAKDKEDIIERALESTKAVFDFYTLQDTGSTDKTVEVFEKWCKRNNREYKVSKKIVGVDYPEVIVDGKKMLANFGMARNDSLKLIPKGIEYAFWMDTDDVLVGAENISTLAGICNKNAIHSVLMEYEYAKSQDGVKPVTQQRERLIDLRKKGKWENWVHENYKFQEQVNIVLMSQMPFDIHVEHLRTPFEALATNRRNNLIMKMQLEKEGIENVSEEFLNHLAYDHFEHKEWDESIQFYNELLKRFNNKQIQPEYLFQTFIKVAKAHFYKGEIDHARVFAGKAIDTMPNIADGYLLQAEIYASRNNWKQVEHYANEVLALGKPNTTAPINEYDYYIVPWRMKMQVHIMRNELKEALTIAKQLMQSLPGNPQFKQEYFNLQKEFKKQNAIKAVGELALYYQENNKAELLDRLRAAIPTDLLEEAPIRSKIKELKHDFKRKTIKYKLKGPKTIVIYAGAHIEPWDGNSDIKKGIGGSEGMCIQMARELAKLGNKVIIYNECGDSDNKDFDGVLYLHHSKWNADIKADVFIALRRPDNFGALIKAKKQYLWLHDTGYGDVPLTNLYAPDKIFVLSDFHKNVIKFNHGIEDDSIFHITRNSINKLAVEYGDKNAKERNPYQIIWGSSYDRGLSNLLDVWPYIKEQVPEATLKAFYGWDTYDGLMRARAEQNPQWAREMQKFKTQLLEKIAKCKDVYELGRISQNELYKEFAESSIWAYPTQFEEISCITAMTAQAMGAVPVCTPFAALNETVNSKYGVKIELDKYAQALVYSLKNQESLEKKRKPMMEWARKQFDAGELAKEWDLFFNNN